MNLENAKRSFQKDNKHHKSDLSELDTAIEQQQCQWDLCLPQAQVCQTSGKAKSMQKPEGKSNDPGMPYGETGAAPP
jgi:hypothetical protein